MRNEDESTYSAYVRRRRSLLASTQSRRAALRCPACFLIRDYTLRDFKCTLTRCPHLFAEIEPPTIPPPAPDNDQARSNLKRLAHQSLRRSEERDHEEGSQPSNDNDAGPAKPHSDIMTVAAVATYLKVNRATVYRLMRHHGLHGFRIGAHWCFDIETVERWRLQYEELPIAVH